ncbi:Hypothetical protein NTJ_06508 [Nesidiocoris tenuis]|uniref:Sulfur globule protein CV3 n=1 Tax=Nesidiocoris tenuis TaxID=355587 RepID=A0ABN7AN88_9HEMI|nr:Hypothetical protein NTJ_06508 [Nesidiocoris tenuis]
MPNFNSMLIFLAMIVACFADMSHKNTEKDAKSQILAPTQRDMMKQAEKQDSSPSKDLKVDESIGFGFYAGIGSPFGYRSYYPSYYPYYRPYYYRPYWRYPYYGSYFG